jgi:exopolysaccharide biosynthesis polyprenyl glycosylphosphotransferase
MRVSLVFPQVASPFQLRSPMRRLVVVLSGRSAPLPHRISARVGDFFQVARIVDPSALAGDGKLSAELDPEVLIKERIWAVVLSSGSQDLVSTVLLFRLQMHGIRVLTEASFWEQEAYYIDPDSPDTSWLLSARGFRYGRAAKFGKTLMDIVLATAILLLTLPLMLVVAIIIKLDSAGPVLYRQERVGLHGRSFTLFKFRSMHQDAEAGGRPLWAAIGDPRVTRAGRFIRYTRIDELPQLLNVLRGEMSLVGPRPERPYFVERLAASIPLYSVRHYVKPGISGWAQVNASYGASTEDAREKLRYDLYYIKHRSFILDLLILWRTVGVVVYQQGAR